MFTKAMEDEKAAVKLGERSVPVLPVTEEEENAKKRRLAGEHERRKKEEEKKAKEEAARLFALTLFGSLKQESQDIFRMLNITLSPEEPDPAVFLIGHIARATAALHDLIGVLEKEGKDKAIAVPNTYVKSINIGIKDFLVKALGYQVNFEPDRFVGACFFDASHVTLQALPYLAVERDTTGGHRALLHYDCVYEERTPQLVDESVKLVSRYNEECCSVPNAEGNLPLHAACNTMCLLDISETIDRLIQIYPPAAVAPNSSG